MSIEDRREREKTQLREAILRAAIDMAAEEGWSKVSIRGISKRIDYSTMIIYSLFGSKEKLLEELSVHGFEKLSHQIKTIPRKEENLRETMLEITRCTVNFFLSNRELYQIMFGVVGLSGVRCTSQPQDQVMDIADYIKAILSEILQDDPQELFFHWWALVHGAISMGASLSEENFRKKIFLLERALIRFLRE